MSAIRLRGATSGTTDVVAAAIAGDGVLSLPSGTGTLATAAFVNTAVAAGGKVLQVVRATDSTNRATTSTTFVDASLSVTITPTADTSNILLIHSCGITVGNSSSGYTFGQQQITDSGNTQVSGAKSTTGTRNYTTSSPSFFASVVLMGWASPATTSATTYKVRFMGSTLGTISNTLENANITGQLFAIEVAA